MATLASLFNESSQDIYKKFSARQSPQDQPYVSIRPDTAASRSRIKDDSRALPVVSTLRDLDRISKFLKSSDGLLFIAKQSLLQTGNTFVNTKLYNPLSPALNTVPFLHIKRYIDTTTVTPVAFGLLQNATVDDVSAKFLPNSTPKSFVATQLKKVANTIIPLPQEYSTSRPEYKIFYTTGQGKDGSPNTRGPTGPRVFEPQPLNQRGLPKVAVSSVLLGNVRTAAIRGVTATLNKLVPKSLRNTVSTPQIVKPPQPPPTFAQAAEDFKNKFTNDIRLKRGMLGAKQKVRLHSVYLNDPNPGDDSDSNVNPSLTTDVTSGGSSNGKKIIQDPYNIVRQVNSIDTPLQSTVVAEPLTDKLNYANIIKEQEKKSDIIKFIFREANGSNPVHFRALMSSIKESIKTEFNEQRYVGRTERFVTYGGVKRGVNLSFNIVAFSEDELSGMWSRVNYLSGLAFPKKIENGFMVPPLFKITIGNIYENQPCYIESLDYDFLDESITFDIDNEVPFSINVTMQLSILEKSSKFHDSPFYKISQDIADVQSITVNETTQRNLDRALLNAANAIDVDIATSRRADEIVSRYIQNR